MNAIKSILAGALLSLCMPVIAAQSGNITVSHYEPLQRLIVQSASSSVTQKSANSGPVSLRFDALGKSFDLRLEPNVSFLSTASMNVLPGDIGIYRGELAGIENSWARIVVFQGAPRGFVWDGDQMYVIEASGGSIGGGDSPIIYRLADTFIQPGTMSCGTTSFSGSGAAAYSNLVSELGVTISHAIGAVSEIDIGAVGDFEFASARANETAAIVDIADRMNRVDGIFSQEIGVQINVPLIEIYSDPNLDPFTDETSSNLLLGELRTYRENNSAQDALGLTHLWTGRDLDGSTVGVAYNGVLCRSGVGAGLSEGNGTPGFDSLVAAHEIGHNFGAPHDGDPGLCESEPLSFIMAPMINGSRQFSQCSISIMQTNAAQAACVKPLATVDMSVGLNGQSPTALLGTETVLRYEVPNNGSLMATNVVADFAIPTNLTIDAVETSVGTCTDGAGSVNCVLGDVGGLSVNTVTITTTASTVGVGMLSATVTSDTDERPVNNQETFQLTVDPAVDLLLNSPSTVTVTLDQGATINATLENRAALDATGVTLSISFGDAVQVNNASWSIGSCSVTAQQVNCQATNFSSQSNASLSIGLTGLTAGSQGYNATMSSNEADADPVNNAVNGTVTVNDPTDESGGGAFGLPFLWILGLVALTTGRRRNHA